MNKKRQSEIINLLWPFGNGSITHEQLDAICKDRAEKTWAICQLRGMNIRIKNEYRTLAFGEQAQDAFRRRKDMERELTIQRKQERQHKKLLRSA
jgi:hypothetical protein